MNEVFATMSPVFLDDRWADLISQLLPILLVVAVGVLTVLKRLFERFILKKEPPVVTDAEDGGERRPQSVLEEIRRNVEMLEGRDASTSTPREAAEAEDAPTTDTARLPPPRPAPRQPKPISAQRQRGDGARSIESGNLEDMALDPLAPGANPLIARRDRPLIGTRDDYAVSYDELGFDAEAVKASIRVSHADLRAGSDAAERPDRRLDRVRLAATRRGLREAMLWSEILAPPLSMREPTEPR